MSHPQNPAVVLADATFAWPDGTPALTSLTAAFGTGRTGLIGANGAGKSTLLRLIAGELTPTSGTVSARGRVGYLPQQLTLRTEASVADLLGVGEHLAALHALEAGDASAATFDALEDDWDVENRARATLDREGLSGLALDRRLGTLSGGEAMLAALAGLRLSGHRIVLLDEPTNNLDREARHRLYDTIARWRGALIVVSHDVTLLDVMDETAELRAGELTVHGGNYTAYQEHLAGEQQAAEQALRTAEQTLRTEQRQRITAQTTLARRRRYARTDFENKRKPKVVMNQRKREAQVSAGKLRGELDAKVDAAAETVEQQAERVRSEERIRIDLPDPGVPAARRLAELHDGRGVQQILQGPQRIALTGPTGIGKTRLLETLVHPERAGDHPVRAIRHTDHIGYLPQRLDHLDATASILDTVRAAAPDAPPHEIRANLARFLLRAETVHRAVGDLSGGERFRVALAALLLAQPPPQLLVLDEPTNNLDLRSLDEFVDALDTYRGGILVVSHDDAFLARLGVDTWITLGADGLTAGAPFRPSRGSGPPRARRGR